MNKFSENLKYARGESGMTRAELAKKLNVSVRLISYWECGRRECSFDMLAAIADVFSVSTDWLLGRTDY